MTEDSSVYLPCDRRICGLGTLLSVRWPVIAWRVQARGRYRHSIPRGWPTRRMRRAAVQAAADGIAAWGGTSEWGTA